MIAFNSRACLITSPCTCTDTFTHTIAHTHSGPRDDDPLLVEPALHRVHQREMVQLLRDYARGLLRLGLLVHDGPMLPPLRLRAAVGFRHRARLHIVRQ